MDDLLGVFGLETETGKTTIGDLREGKRTVLISYATTTREWSKIEPLVGKVDLTDAEADSIRSLSSPPALAPSPRVLPGTTPTARSGGCPSRTSRRRCVTSFFPVADAVLGRVK